MDRYEAGYQSQVDEVNEILSHIKITKQSMKNVKQSIVK